jgi:hypothetical protein
VAFIPPVTPGHVDPESERYNARSRIQSNSMWSELLGVLVKLAGRPLRAWRARRDRYPW